MQDLFSLKDYCIIVTGANRGLGKEMVVALTDEGANIVLTCRDLEKIGSFVKDLKKKNVEVLTVKMDVRNKKEIDSMVERVVDKFGSIDVLVNNAAICKVVEAEKMLFKDWTETIDVNLNGVFLVSQAVGKYMIEKKQGSIINISSISGFVVTGPQTVAAYCVSKAGVIMLTKCLAFEWAKYNIKVNSIAPGYTTEGMAKPIVSKCGDIVDKWLSLIPMGRFGHPSELIGILIYLASKASSYTTGETFLIDGGYTIR